MSTPLSLDLRLRAVAAAAAGMSHREVARVFTVSAASVSRWRALERAQGEPRSKPMGGDQRSHHIERHGELILSLYEATPDIEKLPNEPSRRSGIQSGTSSTPSRPPNAPITSPTQAMIQPDRIPL
jgi:Homeodomain-like domain